jgi:hypothetical protein
LVSVESNDLASKENVLGSNRINTKFDFSRPTTNRPYTTGIDLSDGWADKNSAIQLPVFPDASSVVFEIDYPGWRHLPATNTIKISMDGGSTQSYVLTAGANIIKVPAPVGFTLRNITIESDKSFTIPSPDNRNKAYQLISLESN